MCLSYFSISRSPSVQENSVAVKHDLVTSPNWSSRGSFRKLVLCCSALTNSEQVNTLLVILQFHLLDVENVRSFFFFLALQEIVSEFERISGVTVSKKWESNVTHVIASTDESGACKRTLKVLMGILDGKWILSMKCNPGFSYYHVFQYQIGLYLKENKSLISCIYFAFIHVFIAAHYL